MDGIILLDAENGMIIDVNPAIIEMLAYSQDQFLGKHIWDLGFFRNFVEYRERFLELREKEYFRFEDMSLETADGRRIAIELISNVYQMDDKKIIHCNIRNITERIGAEENLKLINAELERSNKELEQFAYIASHDLQEPLRMISSFTQLLAKRYKNNLGKDADEFIHYIVAGANRMQLLIQDLLAYSRINTNSSSFTQVDSHQAFGEALSNLQISIKETGAIVSNDDLPVIRSDYRQLVQLFQILSGMR